MKAIFINIFGGITKGNEVANGIVEALGRVEVEAPIVIRLDGTTPRRAGRSCSPTSPTGCSSSPPCSTPPARPSPSRTD